MEQQNNEPLTVELSSQLVTIMTTEHYNLQTGRAMTISEANGRSSLFVGAVSSGLIALAFVGQLSHLGTAFYVFSLVILPTLLFMGLITFERVLQSGSTDIIYAHGINRMPRRCSPTSSSPLMMIPVSLWRTLGRCIDPGGRSFYRWLA
jgi:hypothetical protein